MCPTGTQVLVVGAGPTGLVTVITLASLGVQVTIVDSSPLNQNGSRAAIAHSHTLEILDTIGLANTLIEAGLQSRGVLFRGKTHKLVEFNITQLRHETKFPMTVHITQDEVERLFRERLESDGIEILRNKNVVGWAHDIASQGVQVKFEDGTTIRAQYVVGADGSHSAIRHLSGIGFKDPWTGVAYGDAALRSFHMALADVYLEEPLPPSIPHDRLSAHLNTFLLLGPLRSPPTHPNPNPNPNEKPTSFWRIGYGIPAGSSTDAPHAPHSRISSRKWTHGTHGGARSPSHPFPPRRATGCASPLRTRSSRTAAAAAAHTSACGRCGARAFPQGMNLGKCDGVAAARAICAHIQSNTVAGGDSGRRMRNGVLRVVRHLPEAGARRMSDLVNRTN